MGDLVLTQDFHDCFCLIFWHNLVIFSLKEEQRTLNEVGKKERRTFMKDRGCLRKDANQGIGVMFLEFMSILHQVEQVGYPV